MSSSTRVVVTGLGAVTPFGVGVSKFWNSLIQGKSAISAVKDEKLRKWSPAAAQVADFKADEYLNKKQVKDLERYAQFGLVAALDALKDAGLLDKTSQELSDHIDRDRVGISMGTTYGGVIALEEGIERLASSPSARVSPRLVSKSIPNSAAGAIAIQYGIRGPVLTYSTACASSSNAIGEALYWLKADAVDYAIVGGAECLFSPAILAGLNVSGALAVQGPEDYPAWSRPFDANRNGMVMGEGAAILVLEPLDKALARNANIYAELIGYGTSNDAYHETSPLPEGTGAALAMEKAMKAAGVKPEQINYINAHATATRMGDFAESKALHRVFEDHLHQIPVSSIKGAVGHMLGASGAIESIASILALQTGWLPLTLNCDTPDMDAPPNLIRGQSLWQQTERALSNSFGFGGQNSVLLWQSWNQETGDMACTPST